MAYGEVNNLIRFLGDSAHDLSIRAGMTAPQVAKRLSQEAEELLALRTRLLQRVWTDELAAQMPLPLSIKEAA